MKAAVIVFPGSNCDRDVARALGQASGVPPHMVWHAETDLPAADLIVLPGGFSYGDYLRSGAIAARAPIMTAVVARARAGVPVLGICNGFQVLTETGLLPGALMRNQQLRFVCRTVPLRVENTESPFTRGYRAHARVNLPVAHADGNYFADPDTLNRLEGDGRIAFRYRTAATTEPEAPVTGANPNGSVADIAGIFNETRTVLGLMPHPERAVEPAHGNRDGAAFFHGLVEALG